MTFSQMTLTFNMPVGLKNQTLHTVHSLIGIIYSNEQRTTLRLQATRLPGQEGRMRPIPIMVLPVLSLDKNEGNADELCYHT